MNLVLLYPEDFLTAHVVRICGKRHDHITRVTRSKTGDNLQCGLMNGQMGHGTILNMDKNNTVMHVNLDKMPPAPLPLKLILALPRPKMLRRVLESATALGVKDIFLINAWRVEKSYWQSQVLSPDDISKCLTAGLEQSKDTMLPRVHQHRFFSKFAHTELSKLSAGSLCLVAHPKGGNLLPRAVTGAITLAIGPEGGFIDLEIETFEKQGFQCVTAGTRIMRVETAVPYFIAALCA